MKPIRRTPHVINLTYLVIASLLLLLAPVFMKTIFQALLVPDYMVRMCGALVLGFAAVIAHALRAQDLLTLQYLGLIQAIVALLHAGIISLDKAPSTFWVFVWVNAVLGTWTLLSAREAWNKQVAAPGEH